MTKRRIIYQTSLLNPHKSIMVAISGGVDSIALAHFMSQSKRIKLFHFNHKLRFQNDQMEEQVRNFADKLNLSLIVKSADDYPFSLNSSMEAAARSARLKAMQDLDSDQIIVCHHLDDCIESYLMNTMNGVLEEKKYYCIPPKTEMKSFTLLRPFLLTRKKTLIDYSRRHNLIDFVVEDESNQDNTIRRNNVRNSILPLLREEWPGIDRVVTKFVQQDYKKSLS